MQANPYNFITIRALLVDSDKFKQTDGARQVFDEWYRVARLFAGGSVTLEQMVHCTNECFQLMFILHAPGLFVHPNIDYYVISSLMKGFRNILTILSTKPKFQPICIHESFIQMLNWLQKDGMDLLVTGSRNDRLDSIIRMEYSESIASLLDFGCYLMKTYPQVFAYPPFFLLSPEFFTIGFNNAENLSFRSSVLRSVSAMLQINSIQTLPIAAPLVRDEEGCRVFWTRSILNNQAAVEILQKAVYSVISKGGLETLLLYYNSLNESISRLFVELNECHPQEVDTILYHLCNVLAIVVSLTENPASNELSTTPEEVIAGRTLLQSLVHYFPNNPFVLDFVFSEQVIQLFPIATIISPYIDTLEDRTLVTYLFPYLTNTISNMSVAGVSGNEEDQDTINLLRDLAQSILYSATRRIDYSVGHMLFHSLLLAMRRGYIETERFPEVTANVIALYAVKPSSIPLGVSLNPSAQGSNSWILELFEGTEDRHRDMRAIKEVIAVIMGMHEENTTMDCKIDPEVSDCIIEQFLRIHNMEVLQIFRDILLSASTTNTSISVNVQAKLLYNINNWIINDSIHLTQENIKTIFLPLLRALTSIIHSSLAYLLLEITTRVLLLYNNLNFGHPGNPTIKNTNEEYVLSTTRPDSIIDDSLIIGILDRAAQEENQEEEEMYYTSVSVIQKLIDIAGVSSRVRIAEFFPYYCLTDESVVVRRAALESLLHFPDLIYKYYNEVLLALEMRVFGDEAHINIGLTDLFVTAAPILKLLAQHDLQLTPQCIMYLVEGIEFSTENDLMNEPAPALISALRSIYASTNPQDINMICETIQRTNSKLYSVLIKYCPEWTLEKKINPTLYTEKPITYSQHQTDPWTNFWNLLRETQMKGPAGYLECVPLIQKMRQNETVPQRRQMLTQYIMSTLLPSISAYYLPQRDSNYVFAITPVFLVNSSSVTRVIQLLREAFPQESEYLLHLDSMSQQLVQALQQAGYDAEFIRQIEQQLEKPLMIYRDERNPFEQYQRPEECTAESMKRYQEKLEDSKKRLQAYADQIVSASISQSTASFDSISVLNQNDQLEELGVILTKRQESKASIAGIESNTTTSEPKVSSDEKVIQQDLSVPQSESTNPPVEEVKESDLPEVPSFLDLPSVPTEQFETVKEPKKRVVECE